MSLTDYRGNRYNERYESTIQKRRERQRRLNRTVQREEPEAASSFRYRQTDTPFELQEGNERHLSAVLVFSAGS